MIEIEECIKFIENKMKDNQNTDDVKYYEALKYHLESYKSLNNSVIESIDKLDNMVKECRYGHIKTIKPTDEEAELLLKELEYLENHKKYEIRNTGRLTII